jgi:succinyl-CoA synthetase beta subunit
MVTVTFDTSIEAAAFPAHVQEVFATAQRETPWLATTKLVAKPDQLIKRRGKAGLLGINLDWEGAKNWIAERAGKDVSVGSFGDSADTRVWGQVGCPPTRQKLSGASRKPARRACKWQEAN